MNKVMLVGRLTNDPDVRVSDGKSAVARFSIAVNRRFKNAEGNYEADFPNCVAFGKTAEFVQKYFKKGMSIGIVGRLQTGNYTNKDGVKVYTTDVMVDEVEFVESKNSASTNNTQTTTKSNSTSACNDSFINIPDGVEDSELPFN